ncbi:male sterility protein [Phyllosticta citrichinensis]|uniref:Male sterility protein n=1 Tax=Phyllosticta citrichinensis TaxID=1130410 RepID=A0ABR1XV00_9PEZI
MAPIALSDVSATAGDEVIPEIMDPSILPAEDAPERVKKFWNLHGHLHSKEFANPELTSIASLVKHNSQTQLTNPAFLFPTTTTNDPFQIVTWHEFYGLVCSAVRIYAQILAAQIQDANRTHKQPTIALLGIGNTIDYLIAQIALNQVRHLLGVCEAMGIITDKENYAILDAQLVSLAELESSKEKEDHDESKVDGFEAQDVWNLQSMVLHSSGSTGMPKPIIHTNCSLCLIARMYRLFPTFVVDNWYLCFPLFHIAGLCIAFSGLPNGLPTTMPPLQWPPAPGTILTAFRALASMGMPADCLHSAPSVIEDLYGYISATMNDFSPLMELKVVQPGGAPLGEKVLKELVAKGINVKTTYGSTEIGPPFRSIPHTRDNPHCYRLRNLYPESPLVQMEPLMEAGADDPEAGTRLFECVIYKGFELTAELWLAPDAPNPYRTNDLFFEDPPGSGNFVLLGRKDDVLVLGNGEKTHAGMMVALLEEEGHRIVHKAAVFGNGRPCVAAIVQLAEGVTSGSGDFLQVLKWVNQKSAKHARIDKEMVLVLNAGESLPVTPKGNVQRKEAWKIYSNCVDALYEHYLGAASADEEPSDETLASLPDKEFIRATVAEVCDMEPSAVEDGTSFYDLGLDSQRAVKLRSRLVKRFGTFPLMFIFECPSVEKLLVYLQGLKNGDAPAEANEVQQLKYVQDLIQSYNSTIDGWTSSRSTTAPPPGQGAVVYLTGASSALGNALLENLVAQEHVSKVYCAIRGPDPRIKLIHSLKQRGYDEAVYCSGKIHTIPYDMKDEHLGSGEELFNMLTCEVTVVVHNAWKMDFNQKVEEFEKDCLKGTMHLLKFCQTGTQKTFSIMSSVTACMGEAAKGRKVLEEPVSNDPRVALSTGYGQSKYIMERVTQHYSAALSSPVKLFRVGQLCGHSCLSVWNTSEMWPIMIATGLKHLQAMPELPGTVINWLPVNMCASSISKKMGCSKHDAVANGEVAEQKKLYTVHNLVNPATSSWIEFLDVLAVAAPETHFECVDMTEWVRRLENAAEEASADAIPGLKLLRFFQDMKQEANGEGVQFKTASVEAGSKVTVEIVCRWLDQWKSSRFL